MRFIDEAEVLAFNSIILGAAATVINEAGLKSALARPGSSAFGQDAYNTIFDKAYALAHSLALNHPFADGNKRTALMALLVFLEKNGISLRDEKHELGEDILNMVLHKITQEQFVARLKQLVVENLSYTRLRLRTAYNNAICDL